MTNGGLGIGFFIPFNYQRYFLPWKPIAVSPIGISGFFSNWGVKVLKNELMLLVIPSITLAAITLIIRRIKRYYRNKKLN
jgi:inner membrane protein